MLAAPLVQWHAIGVLDSAFWGETMRIAVAAFAVCALTDEQ
jgi:hypothetical protein